MRNRRTAAFALVAIATWACSPDEYPTESRFEPPPEEIELPDGELFFYTPPAGVTVTSVSVPGQFNDWNPNAPSAQMIELADGRWVAGIELEPGSYEYKYHFNGSSWAGNMCNDGTWGDPDNGGQVDPNLTACNGETAVRLVGPPAPAGHTFLYIPRNKDVQVVTVAGNFQPGEGWNNQSDTLTNIWEITVDLEPGTYEYKYVFNDEDWAQHMCEETQWGDPTNETDSLAVDPDNSVCVDGGNGVITIDEAGPHTFRYIVPAGADSIAQIHLAGAFQDWNPNDPNFLFQETFQRNYELPAGSYEYKFIFDGDWGNNMCTDTEEYGDPTTGLVDANNTDGCADGGNALLVIE